jgi:hypothetical protein
MRLRAPLKLRDELELDEPTRIPFPLPARSEVMEVLATTPSAWVRRWRGFLSEHDDGHQVGRTMA